MGKWFAAAGVVLAGAGAVTGRWLKTVLRDSHGHAVRSPYSVVDHGPGPLYPAGRN